MGTRIVMIDDYPELKAVAKARLTQAIRSSKLPRECRIIAFERLVECKAYADIGADVNADRTTVSRRLKKSIPEIKRALKESA